MLGRGRTWPGWAGPRPERTVEGQSRLGWAGLGRASLGDFGRTEPGWACLGRAMAGEDGGDPEPAGLGRAGLGLAQSLFFLGVRTKTLNGPRP